MDIPVYNGYIKQGADWGLTLEYLDANGNAINLTGYTADCEIRDKATGVILATPTFAALGSSGRVALSLTAAQTFAMPAVMSKYDVFITAPTGSPPPVVCLIQGDMEILPRVTMGLPAPLFSLLLVTGQKVSYGSGGGFDDGAYEKGIVKSYTILDTDQYSGTTNITLNSKTDVHSNNCVLDNKTGLMWNRYWSESVGPLSNGVLPWTDNGNSEGIFRYSSAAKTANLSGHNDWRVPNMFELASILDFDLPSAAPDSVAFPGFFGNTVLWTSTTNPSATTQAMGVNFGTGAINVATKTSNYQVILVRG